MSTIDKTSVNELIIPGFAYLNAKKDMKVNVGPTTIGAGSTFQPANYHQSKNLEIESPDISIAGLKIGVKKEE